MRTRVSLWAGLIAVFLALLPISPAGAATVVSAEYRLPAKLDPDIATDVETEIWATLWRPARLTATRHPLVMFLHGNHATCGRFDSSLGVRVDDRSEYTYSGACPRGYSVVPSHLGYAYLAERLAADGYLVVSINANRGVNAAAGVANDSGLNLRRGRLVLRHLQLLKQWNAQGGAPASLGFNLRGKLDLGQIGLVGHSRGGEGMRAALAQYSDRGSPWKLRIGPVGFKALFEIGPVDGQTSRSLNALGVAWNVLLPYCDGDVADLEGVRPFDRMLLVRQEKVPLPKSTFSVYGANHNFYNTEWQESESGGCVGPDNVPLFPRLVGSPAQRATAINTVVPFIKAHVGRAARPAQARLFNPDIPLPAVLTAITRVDRGYTDTPDLSVVGRLEDFNGATGTGGLGLPILAQGLGIEHVQMAAQDDAQRAAAITWSGTGTHLLQINVTRPGRGLLLTRFKTLEFRVSRQCREGCSMPNPMNPAGPTDFTVQLVRPNGSLSMPVRLASHLDLRGPVGFISLYDDSTTLHPILETARIPLSEFGLGADATVRGVRFTFDRTGQGAIYLANIRLSERNAKAGQGALVAQVEQQAAATALAASAVAPSIVKAAAPKASIVAVRRAAAAATTVARSAGQIEIEVAADQALPVTDALPTITIGDQRIDHSRFVPGGGTDRLVFTLDAERFAELPDGAPAELRVGASRRMALGRLDKSSLR